MKKEIGIWISPAKIKSRQNEDGGKDKVEEWGDDGIVDMFCGYRSFVFI